MHVPMDLDVQLDKESGTFECFAPKRIVHTWTGHAKGVNAIRFFPKSGHMILSASQDCRIKVNFYGYSWFYKFFILLHRFGTYTEVKNVFELF